MSVSEKRNSQPERNKKDIVGYRADSNLIETLGNTRYLVKK